VSSPLSILDYRQPVEFRIGDVLVKSWGALSRHFLTFFVLAGSSQLPALLLRPGPKEYGRIFALLGLNIVLSAFAQAVVVYAAFQDLRGQAVSASESLTRGMARFFPVIVLSVLMGLIVGVGFVLCFIPGLIAFAALQVALPVCVVERLNPFKCISRSADLTSGHWWPILGVLAAIIAINLAVAGAVGAALPRGSLPATVVLLLWHGVATAYSSVFAAILYHDLRAVKEGIGIEQIASVFD
jgi:hypothetical protein